jgi:hypothetical protein
LETESEFHCIHGLCVILQEAIYIGDELGVDLIVRRERSRGITFWYDPSVLGRNEFEGSVDKITEARRSSATKEYKDEGDTLI